MATKEFFPGIEKIKFEGKDSKNPMAFRYYDAEKVINGKKMKDWLRFAMAWWHTLCAEGGDQFGGGTKQFPWNSNADAIQAAKDKMDAGGFKVNGIFERDDLTGFNWSKVPVVLVEMGFMSNYNEDEMMSNKDYQKKMMQSIADGVEEYFKTN